MAPLWLLLLIIAAAVGRLPIQDGFSVNISEALQRQWEWTASDGGIPQDDSFLLRRRRESRLRNASKALDGPPKNGFKMSTLKKPTQELTTVTQSPRSSVVKKAKLPKDGTYRVSKTSSERPPTTKGALTTTEHWSWLHDDLSSAPAETLGTESFTKPSTLRPVLKAKGRLTTTIDGLSTKPAGITGIQNPARPRSKNGPSPYHTTTMPLKMLMDDDDTSAVTTRPSLDLVRTRFGDKKKQIITTSAVTTRPSLGPIRTGFGDKKKQGITTSAVTTRPSLGPIRTGFGDKKKQGITTSTVTTRPSLGPIRTGFGDKRKQSVTTSAVTTRPSLGPIRTGFGAKGKQGITISAVTTRPSLGPIRTRFGATTSPVPASNASIVRKCLLAISLLALVASIFIVTAAVLACLLWRQKQAYRLNRHNQTEMVCISSLLAAEEAEEGRAKRPRVERVRMLRENGTEAESDNLTLNSFLPDH
ncbi:P-selectin glycoprotein ligand 1 [Anolis carolinensis]|uniref:Uncharacterized protein n=1 Tax=Anolis carolinensis TaxID=28377 RepID=R4GA92_ANOCA|nr:PREDICTED: P-selectin glycoprotein ligand 1 [Anolis carolinensis]|eukprot:XP_008121665.1 PREDICTED: P-selectin glycoprotein ligand 1 [Anolis carolinensis]